MISVCYTFVKLLIDSVKVCLIFAQILVSDMAGSQRIACLLASEAS